MPKGKGYGPGNMGRAAKPKTGSNAFGRDGGAAPKKIRDKVERMAVSKSSLTKKMPG